MNKEKALNKKMTIINEESSENSSNSQIRNSEKKITPKNPNNIKTIFNKSLSRNILIDNLININSFINKRKKTNIDENINKKSNSVIILRDTGFTFNDFD